MINTRTKVVLHWLNKDVPKEMQGISRDVAWSRGLLDKVATLTLLVVNKKNIPGQSWPTTYRPDGIFKWRVYAIG